MSRKGYKPEQIINMLREAEVALSGGQTVFDFHGTGPLRLQAELLSRPGRVASVGGLKVPNSGQ